jgi:hypothetical protein
MIPAAQASPFFVIGSPRSGTSMFRLMLASHRDFAVPPECGFAVWWRAKHGGYPAGTTLGAFLEDLAASKKIETWGLDFARLRAALEEERPADYAGLVDAVYRFYAAREKPGFRRWGDKNNFHVREVDALRELFPAARFLHLMRDGRDVACSYLEVNRKNLGSRYAPRFPDSVERIAELWAGDVAAARDAFGRCAPGSVMELRFEELVRSPGEVLRGVCGFLGEAFDPGMLDYPRLNAEKRLEPVEFLAWKENTLKAPLADRAGRYRADLSAPQVAAFERVAGEMLRACGYLEGGQ